MGAPLFVLVIIVLLSFVLLGILIYQFAKYFFISGYRKDLKLARDQSTALPDTITEKDLLHLPEPVKKFLRRIGVLGKPKVYSFSAKFNIQMRGKDQDWFEMKAEQYNSISDPQRLFFLNAKIKGLPTLGYHCYKNKNASMLIKLFGLFPIVNIPGGDKMFQAETVTFFNDMCIMAPACLIDTNIQWEAIDDRSAKAVFSNKGQSISATLFFDEEYRLVNFISDDRYDINEGKTYRFSTPLSEHTIINGVEIPAYGEAIWHYPEGEFVYGKFQLQVLSYNV
jgi:hypothetical protein